MIASQYVWVATHLKIVHTLIIDTPCYSCELELIPQKPECFPVACSPSPSMDRLYSSSTVPGKKEWFRAWILFL